LPEPDDTITISSSLNVTSQVQFKLNLNHVGLSKYSREFRAEFTPESATEFTVGPKMGNLSLDDPSK
jgi:hypothetical protein